MSGLRARTSLLRERIRSLDRSERTLVLLIAIGSAVRIVAMLTVWPTITTEADSGAYASFAAHDPLADFQHPAGYSLFLALGGLVTRQVVAFMVVQHLAGIVAAISLFAAVRRMVGSPWPALVGAGFILLNADQIYAEQTVMSEWLFTFLLALSLYATVRAISESSHALGWSLAAGAITAAAIIVRTEGILLPVVYAATLCLSSPSPRRRQWKQPTALLAAVVAILVCYAGLKDIDTGRFELGPSPGWQLYAKVAPFADCSLFTPTKGTAGLCQSSPPSQRPGHDVYLYDRQSPAVRLFGRMGNQDGLVGAWARDVLVHQPGPYFASAYHTLRDYYVPSSFVPTLGAGYYLDTELDWHITVPKPFQAGIVAQLRTFFAPFRVQQHPRRMQAMRVYQRVFRFGAAVLTICTLLAVLGLAIGPRQARLGVMLFGVSGFVNLLPPALVASYIGRYQVPIAGPMGAAAAITLWTLWRMERLRRRVDDGRERKAGSRGAPYILDGQLES